MRLIAALLVTVLLTVPANAARTCWFEAPSGERLTFLNNGENEVVRQYPDGQTETCVVGHADDGAIKIWCDVETKTESLLGGVEPGLEAFGVKWLHTCI